MCHTCCSVGRPSDLRTARLPRAASAAPTAASAAATAAQTDAVPAARGGAADGGGAEAGSDADGDGEAGEAGGAGRAFGGAVDVTRIVQALVRTDGTVLVPEGLVREYYTLP